ncbi:unnamed protein product [Trichobilharzia szidati]|nr:unnamed protein product [Trichobilharzia szidati]
MSILKITGRQILDSRGYPTVEVDVITNKGLFRAAAPSGASTGIYEANELRDNGQEFLGKGVLKAVNNVNKIIAPALIKKNLCVTEQTAIDEFIVKELDGTPNKTHLGANAILAVSLAILKAGAAEKNLPVYRYVADLAGNVSVTLPVPAFNVLNGGKHAGNKLAFQEFMIFPVGATSFAEALRMGSETYHHLRRIIQRKYGVNACNVGDEGGFAPNISTPIEALDLIVDAIVEAGYVGKIVIGIDVAASEMYSSKNDKKYNFDFKESCSQDQTHFLTGDKLLDYYTNLSIRYPLVSIEDPFDQDDWDNWIKLRSRLPIQIKTGAPCRSERLAKYNQLLRIEEELGCYAVYAGNVFRSHGIC